MRIAKAIRNIGLAVMISGLTAFLFTGCADRIDAQGNPIAWNTPKKKEVAVTDFYNNALEYTESDKDSLPDGLKVRPVNYNNLARNAKIRMILEDEESNAVTWNVNTDFKKAFFDSKESIALEDALAKHVDYTKYVNLLDKIEGRMGVGVYNADKDEKYGHIIIYDANNEQNYIFPIKDGLATEIRKIYNL